MRKKKLKLDNPPSNKLTGLPDGGNEPGSSVFTQADPECWNQGQGAPSHPTQRDRVICVTLCTEPHRHAKEANKQESFRARTPAVPKGGKELLFDHQLLLTETYSEDVLTSPTERRMLTSVTQVRSKTRNTENRHKIQSDLREGKTACELEVIRALLLRALQTGSAAGCDVGDGNLEKFLAKICPLRRQHQLRGSKRVRSYKRTSIDTVLPSAWPCKESPKRERTADKPESPQLEREGETSGRNLPPLLALWELAEPPAERKTLVTAGVSHHGHTRCSPFIAFLRWQEGCQPQGSSRNGPSSSADAHRPGHAHFYMAGKSTAPPRVCHPTREKGQTCYFPHFL